MLAALHYRLRCHFAAWQVRRSPPSTGPITLTRRRIYILPTRIGGYFGLLLFAMFIGAINYNNNLAFALTFLLAGIGLAGMHHTHRNLLNLSVTARRPPEVFAGDQARFTVQLANPAAVTRYAVVVGDGGAHQTSPADVPAGGAVELTLPLAAQTRGPLPLPRLRLETVFPMGLFRAWSWIQPDLAGIVYPAPAGEQPLPAAGSGASAGNNGGHAGQEDFVGLRRYERGDPPRLIHWKSLPRTGELMTKQFSVPVQRELWLDWAALSPLATETRLSQLTRWLLEAERAGLACGLRLPGTEIAPAAGRGHRDYCLRCLALFALDDVA